MSPPLQLPAFFKLQKLNFFQFHPPPTNQNIFVKIFINQLTKKMLCHLKSEWTINMALVLNVCSVLFFLHAKYSPLLYRPTNKRRRNIKIWNQTILVFHIKSPPLLFFKKPISNIIAHGPNHSKIRSLSPTAIRALSPERWHSEGHPRYCEAANKA